MGSDSILFAGMAANLCCCIGSFMLAYQLLYSSHTVAHLVLNGTSSLVGSSIRIPPIFVASVLDVSDAP